MRVPGCSPVRRGHAASPVGVCRSPVAAFITSSPRGSSEDLAALERSSAVADECAGLALLPPPAHPFWRSADVAEQARRPRFWAAWALQPWAPGLFAAFPARADASPAWARASGTLYRQVHATCASLEAERAAAVGSVAAERATWTLSARRLEAALAAERARADAAAQRAARAEEAAAAATAEAAALRAQVPNADALFPHRTDAAPGDELARLRREVDALRAELRQERQRTALMADGAAALRAQLHHADDVGTTAAEAAPPASAEAAEIVALRCSLEAEKARADAASAREAAAAAAARRGAAAAATDAPRAAELALALAAEQARSRQLAAALAAAGLPSLGTPQSVPQPRGGAVSALPPPPALVAASAMLASATERAAGAVATRGAAVAGALRRGVADALSAAADGGGAASLAQLASGQHAAASLAAGATSPAGAMRVIAADAHPPPDDVARAGPPRGPAASGSAAEHASRKGPAEDAAVATTPHGCRFSTSSSFGGVAPVTPGESSEDDEQ